ncbi:cell division protein FtsQ [Microbacterium endophyticum]|uniref:FtsQ-type POTRA domain-containing protein n=1 Tax=Microbacterium endophyticum TaxID=1526412 RepID=UPI0013E9EB6B|nr:FtsQ-type POTRA domain-containing protein [Microbacterium endophyticum]NIK36520.1 cell division protein FtsQ [Microbacterium endophyticum]
MRRPTPLPPTSRPPRESFSRAEFSETPASGDGELLAPVVSLNPDREQPAREVEVEVTGEQAFGLESSAVRGSVRWRDVWRAARARRKALRAEVRRFTVRQRRRRMVAIGVVSSLALLVLVTVGAAYSPLFAVEQITVVGTSQLDAGEVSDALADQIGTPLAQVDSSAIKAALVAFPLVETYALEAKPPHELVVRIVERTPLGVVETPAGFSTVDGAGVVLSTAQSAPEDLPSIAVEGGLGSDAFLAAGQVLRSLSDDLRAQVTAVTATSANDVTLTLGGTDTNIVWGSADDSALKSLTLQKLMDAKPPESVSFYDVSSPDVAVVG